MADVRDVWSPLRWQDGALHLIDQRRLPAEETWVRCARAADVAEAIRSMVVRGAPAIGCAAAFGMALAARHGEDLDAAAATLRGTRPTAVNLFWAVDRMLGVRPRSFEALEREAGTIWREDVEACLRIGQNGAPLMPDRGTVLTHCNAGALATGGYGTALGVIRAAREAGKHISVMADETRPFLQGARLTAWELVRDGIPTTLISDGMAGHFLARGEIRAAVVGADRIARNGDVANKIGTYSVAVLCHVHSVPFFVAAPLSTVDLETPTGEAIPIEERDPAEVRAFAGVTVAPAGVAARHPAFDVTPARYVSAIVTEAGVARPPYDRSLAALAGSGRGR
jgi:methylthioribose-1-phosphate isomerase